MTVTEDYTFRLGNTGTILNTSDIGLPFVDITAVRGLSSPPFRETERQREGQDGAYMDAEFEEGRRLILEGDIYADGDGLEDYLDQLKQEFAPSNDPVPFYLLAPGQAARVIFVKPLGVVYDWDEGRRRGSIIRAQFLAFAEDPRIYTDQLKTLQLSLASPSITGFAFNIGFNLSFGGTFTPAGGTVTNDGNRPAPPVFIISGMVRNPRIVNLTGGFTIDTNISLSSGDQLVIDVLNRTAILNGTSNHRSAVVRDEWFLLPPGNTILAYRAGSPGSSTLTVQFRDTWR